MFQQLALNPAVDNVLCSYRGTKSKTRCTANNLAYYCVLQSYPPTCAAAPRDLRLYACEGYLLATELVGTFYGNRYIIRKMAPAASRTCCTPHLPFLTCLTFFVANCISAKCLTGVIDWICSINYLYFICNYWYVNYNVFY